MDSFASFGNSATTTEAPQTLPQYVGYIACVLAAILFGSNFIPVKKFETGDGLFFQLVLCMAIWLPSVVLHAIQGFPRFWPLAMLGGFLWCTGNIMVVPIIQCIGMAMGLLIWGVSNMLTGWATGRFGAFGMDPEPLGNPTLNYFGVALCFISALIVFLIKPHIENVDQTAERTYSEKDAGFINERDPLIPPFSGNSPSINTVHSSTAVKVRSYDSTLSQGPSTSGEHNSPVEGGVTELSFFQRLPPFQRKLAGIIMSIVSGVFYGTNFAPVIYIKDNYEQWYGNCTVSPCVEHVSKQDIDYVFAHFTGILCTSIIYFTIYCIVKKNRPVVYPRVMLPAIISGVMWSIADISFFMANEVLDESVSFPIINAGPGVVASLWGVFLFKEIRGKRNLVILAIAFCFTMAGCLMCGLSK